MSEKQLRPYQQALLDKLKEAFREGYRKILIQSPTGSGKSVFFSKIIGGTSEKDNSTLFLVHRRELIKQASEHMDNESIYHGIIMAGVVPNLYEKTQLASVDTLRSRCITKEIVPWPSADVLVVDEAHHVGSKTYEKIFDKYEDKAIIGVTATPCRANGKGLGHFFEKLIIGPTVRKLMDDGYLAEASYMVPAVPDMQGVKVARGDFVENELAKVMNDAKLIGDVVEHWIKYASDRKTIVFTVNVAHSVAVMERFKEAGIPAAHIDGKTNQAEREQILKDYSNGVYKVLSNCQVFTEGVDMPEVGCVVLARPTKSLSLYLQMAGRGLRPKPDGSDCIILDHAGNVFRHGGVDEEHDWSLDEKTIQERDREKKDKPEKLAKDFICDNCGNIFAKQSVCPKCGTPLGSHGKDIDTAKGELVEFKPKLEKKKKEQFSKQEFYSMLLTQAETKGYKTGWVSHKYKSKFGVWPRGLHHGLMTRTPEFMNYMKYLNIKRVKSANN